jgi:hypothetical protein
MQIQVSSKYSPKLKSSIVRNAGNNKKKEKKGRKNLQWKKTMEAGGVEAGASIARRGLRFGERVAQSLLTRSFSSTTNPLLLHFESTQPVGFIFLQ